MDGGCNTLTGAHRTLFAPRRFHVSEAHGSLMPFAAGNHHITGRARQQPEGDSLGSIIHAPECLFFYTAGLRAARNFSRNVSQRFSAWTLLP